MPGATEAVRRVGARWRLGLASSSPPSLIATALSAAGLADAFEVVLSTEQVGSGKPAPDVYLAVARQLGAAPATCVAIEDSVNGVRSAAAAGMVVLAMPHLNYPLDPETAGMAARTLSGIDALTDELVETVGSRPNG
jgi:HAD superfamily hydrolase (TIGR01509 family)